MPNTSLYAGVGVTSVYGRAVRGQLLVLFLSHRLLGFLTKVLSLAQDWPSTLG